MTATKIEFDRIKLVWLGSRAMTHYCTLQGHKTVIYNSLNYKIFLQRSECVHVLCVCICTELKLSSLSSPGPSEKSVTQCGLAASPTAIPVWRNWRISTVFWGQLYGFPPSDQLVKRGGWEGEKNAASKWKLGRQQNAAEEWFNV